MTEIKEYLQIRKIEYNSGEYKKELELRDEVLRKPLRMCLYDENLDSEKLDFHVGAFINNTLVGVLILTKLNAGVIKMRQFAVTEKWRNLKIGSEMVLFAEQYSKDNGYTKMVLNARKTAVAFYEKLGYKTISEEFLEINIPHYKMSKNL
jgi:predicted GNAT family N-acyltransferase